MAPLGVVSLPMRMLSPTRLPRRKVRERLDVSSTEYAAQPSSTASTSSLSNPLAPGLESALSCSISVQRVEPVPALLSAVREDLAEACPHSVAAPMSRRSVGIASGVHAMRVDTATLRAMSPPAARLPAQCIDGSVPDQSGSVARSRQGMNTILLSASGVSSQVSVTCESRTVLEFTSIVPSEM